MSLWRERILQAVLWAIAVLAFIAYLPSVAIAFRQGRPAVIVLDTVALALLLGLLAARRAPYRLRAGGLLVVCFAVGVYFTWGFGPIAAGPLWLFATPILAALLFGLPGAVLALGAAMASLGVFGVLLHLDLVAWSGAVTVSMWIVISSSFLMLAALLAVSISVLLGGLVHVHAQFERAVDARNRIDRQLEQASRLEALGRMAGGVAHDFNNILTAILGYTEIISSQLGDRRDLAEDVEGITASANRAAELTRQLLAFSRQQETDVVEVDIGSLVASMRSMLRRLVREEISIDIEIDHGLHPVFGDQAQLEQVLLNLVVNAADAIPEKGTIVIGVRQRTLTGDEAIAASVAPGDYVEVTVADSGVGMSEEVRARVFDPFFTTKDAGRGTGLGLATAHGVVVKSGGAIAVESAVGSGTTFRVLLPSAGGPGGAEPTPRHEPSRHGDEAILLVEDDRSIRRLLTRSLTARGFEVHAASCASEANAVANELGSEIRLLLTDVIMPDTSGPDLAHQLEERLPNASVLYMSGYTSDILERHGIEPSADTLIMKPFTSDELATRIRRVLDFDR